MKERNQLEEVTSDLADSIQEIKLNTKILVTKLEQVNDNIEKLEGSVEDLHMSISEQDRRLTVLEQLIPQNLLQDIAVMKESQKTTSKLLWLVGGITLTTFADMLFHVLTK